MQQERSKKAQDSPKRGQEEPNNDFFRFLASNLGRKIGANSPKNRCLCGSWGQDGPQTPPRPPQDPPKTLQDRFWIDFA